MKFRQSQMIYICWMQRHRLPLSIQRKELDTASLQLQACLRHSQIGKASKTKNSESQKMITLTMKD